MWRPPSFLLTSFLLLTPNVRAQAALQEPSPVRLIVLVVTGGVTPDQLARHAPWFEGGLKRLATQGLGFRNAHHDHAVTESTPGHATLATGVHPRRHGLVADTWMGTEGRVSVESVQDDEVQLVTNAGIVEHAEKGTRSPVHLLAPTLGDYLKSLFPESKSVALGMRDRAVIASGGREADVAVWWDRRGYGFVSSTWYADELLPWVKELNESWPRPLIREGYRWQADLPADLLARSGITDERSGEIPFHGGRSLPRIPPDPPLPLSVEDRLRLSQWILPTPLADRLTLEAARAAVTEMALGQDEAVDFLFVGLSASETVGAMSGPSSHEASSILLALDRELGTFFEHLDAAVGPGSWLAAFSSSHGILELPEELAARGYDTRRIHAGAVSQRLNEVRRDWGEQGRGDFYLNHSMNGLRLSAHKLEKAGLDPAEMRAEMRRRFRDVEAMATVYASDELKEPPAEDVLARLFAHAYYPGRSPDVFFVSKPWTVDRQLGTAWGSPWPYDRHVPMSFLGAGVESGVSYEPCATVDLAPTLLHLAGLPVPEGLDGRVLE